MGLIYKGVKGIVNAVKKKKAQKKAASQPQQTTTTNTESSSQTASPPRQSTPPGSFGGGSYGGGYGSFQQPSYGGGGYGNGYGYGGGYQQAPFGQSFYSGARRMMPSFGGGQPSYGGGGYGSPWQGTPLRSPLVPGAIQVPDDRFRRYGRSGFVSKFRS